MFEIMRPSANDYIKLLQSDWFENLSDKLSDTSFLSRLQFYLFTTNLMVWMAPKLWFSLAELEPVRPNVGLISKLFLKCWIHHWDWELLHKAPTLTVCSRGCLTLTRKGGFCRWIFLRNCTLTASWFTGPQYLSHNFTRSVNFTDSKNFSS